MQPKAQKRLPKKGENLGEPVFPSQTTSASHTHVPYSHACWALVAVLVAIIGGAIGVILNIRSVVTKEIRDMKTDLTAQIGTVKADLTAQIGMVKADLRSDIKEIDKDAKEINTRLSRVEGQMSAFFAESIPGEKERRQKLADMEDRLASLSGNATLTPLFRTEDLLTVVGTIVSVDLPGGTLTIKDKLGQDHVIQLPSNGLFLRVELSGSRPAEKIGKTDIHRGDNVVILTTKDNVTKAQTVLVVP